MKKYISKSTLTAKIRESLLPTVIPQGTNYDEFEKGADSERIKILSFLDTLEVKEVDLEKEFDNYAKDILACDVQFEPFTHLYNCAKHFYELGMQQSKNDSNNEE